MPAYQIRLTSIAGPVVFSGDARDALSLRRLMHGTDVARMRIEILRWGSGVRDAQYGGDGIDRYTVGEYEFGVEDSHCLVFKLPRIVHSSDLDSGMFLDKGWASVLIHMRVLISGILGRKFEIVCAHKYSAQILRKYSGLCTIQEINNRVIFTFSQEFNVVALKALFLVMSKIASPKTNTTYQLRMNGLVDTRDQYHDLIV